MPNSFLKNCPACGRKVRLVELDKPAICKCDNQLEPTLHRPKLEQGRNPLEGMMPMVANYD